MLEIKLTERESKQLYFEELMFSKLCFCFLFRTSKDELKFFGVFEREREEGEEWRTVVTLH